MVIANTSNIETPKTIVEVIQQLLALVNARFEKLHKNTDSKVADPEKDKLIKALLDELSLFGDDISSTIDQSHPYFKAEGHDQKLFTRAVQKLHNNAGEIPESLERIFVKVAELK